MRRGAQRVSVALILGLTAACVSNGSAGSGKSDDQATTAAKDVCDIARYLAFAESDLSNKISNYRHTIDQLKTEALATQMLAEKLRGSAAFKGAQLLSILATTRVDQAQSAAPARLSQLTAAARVLNRQLGIARGYGAAAVSKITQGKPTNIASAETPISGGVGHTQTPTLTPLQATHCNLNDDTGSSKVKKPDVKIAETKTIPLIEETKLMPAALVVTAYAKGSPNSAATLQGTHTWIATHSSNTNLLGAKVNVTAPADYVKKQEVYDETKPTPQCGEPQETDVNKQTTPKDAAATICTAILSRDPDPTSVLDQSLDDIATNSEAQTVAALILGQSKKPTDPGQASKQVKDLLGGSEANYQNTYVKAVKTTQITVDLNGVKTTDTLLKLAEKTESADVLAFLIGQNKGIQENKSGDNTESPKKDENVEKTAKKGVDDKAKTDCTATQADKCDKAKCDWNEEKNQCKVKEGAAVISAVIKAPLLLAFLLF
uniref:Variant surface glycoprotein 557 n=1 Tax=Trypanosoma brucei TaxID=5691 RepID=M4TDH9_9TRYP|nr:variant surface glycoprotein 557 [Trypanosoma brucei]